MDYATKAIVIGGITVTIFLLLTQLELLQGIFDSVLEVAKAVIQPVQNLLGNLF